MIAPRRKDFILPAIILFFFLAFMARSYSDTISEWFKALKNQNGEQCCDNWDGQPVEEIGWRTKDGKYQVLIEGKWIDIPPKSVVEGPNRLGQARIWFRYDGTVRCFLPGSLS